MTMILCYGLGVSDGLVTSPLRGLGVSDGFVTSPLRGLGVSDGFVTSPLLSSRVVVEDVFRAAYEMP